jgi:hypothetical protein
LEADGWQSAIVYRRLSAVGYWLGQREALVIDNFAIIAFGIWLVITVYKSTKLERAARLSQLKKPFRR